MNSNENKRKIADILSKFRERIEQKCNNYHTVFQCVLSWTGGEEFLINLLLDLVENYSGSIPQGQEEVIVKQIVQDKIIKNWEINAGAEHLKVVEQSILNDEKSVSFLKLYIKIIQKGEVFADDGQDQQKLLELGLVKKEQGKLKVANAIYANIFNLEWAKKNLPTIPQQKLPQVSLPDNQSLAARSTRIWSGIALFAIIAIAVVYPLFLKPTPNDSKLCTNRNKNIEEEEQLTQLMKKKKEEKDFSQTCQHKLDELLYSTGMEKAKGNGKTNDFNTGVDRLCKISENSDKFTQARIQIKTWHQKEQYKGVIENYLKIGNCPAGKDISPS